MTKKRRRKKRKEVRKPKTVLTTGELIRRIEREKRRKRIFALFAFIVILISIVAAAWYLTSGPPSTGTLIVHTVDENTNEPLTTTITISGPYDATVQSNEQGAYQFESIPTGTYTVSASKPGYHTHTGSELFPETVNVKAGETTNLTIELHSHD